jgi:hypothetical protein
MILILLNDTFGNFRKIFGGAFTPPILKTTVPSDDKNEKRDNTDSTLLIKLLRKITEKSYWDMLVFRIMFFLEKKDCKAT